MPNCSAFGCTNRSDNPDNNATFHRLPSVDKKQAGVWRNKIKRKGAEDLSSLRISSDHFESECFERDLKSELMGTKKRGKLKPNSSQRYSYFPERRTFPEERFTSLSSALSLSNNEETEETHKDACVGNNVKMKTRRTQWPRHR